VQFTFQYSGHSITSVRSLGACSSTAGAAASVKKARLGASPPHVSVIQRPRVLCSDAAVNTPIATSSSRSGARAAAILGFALSPFLACQPRGGTQSLCRGAHRSPALALRVGIGGTEGVAAMILETTSNATPATSTARNRMRRDAQSCFALSPMLCARLRCLDSGFSCVRASAIPFSDAGRRALSALAHAAMLTRSPQRGPEL
jgi:hypothetical protein